MSNSHLIRTCFTFLYFLIITQSIEAASPVNDLFSNRQILGGALPISVGGTTIDATQEAFEPIYRSEGDSVWYQWTAPSAALYKVTLSAVDPAQVPMVGVLAGQTLDTLELLAPDWPNSTAQWQATAGQVYYIHVAAGENVTNGAYTLTLSTGAAITPPANDAFATAATIPAAPPQTINATTAAASLEPREARPEIDNESSPQRSVWYNWTPTTSGWTKITNSALHQVNVYTGTSLTALTQIAASVSGDVRFSAVSGTTYRIQVMSVFAEDSPNFVLSLTRPTTPPPSNDAFGSKLSLGTSSSINRNDTTIGATVESGEKLPADTRATIWYTWTAPSTGAFTIEVNSAAASLNSAVFTGSTLANLVMQSIGQLDYQTGKNLLIFKATGGQVYQFQVGGDGWSEGALNFQLRSATLTDVQDHQLMTGFSATPSSVTVSGAGGALVAEAKFSVNDGAYGYLVAESLSPWRHGGSGSPSRDIYTQETNVSPLNFVDSTTTGNLTEHRYSNTISLPSWVSSGTYSFHYNQSSGGGTFGTMKYDAPIPGGGMVIVNNTAAVDALPSLTSFTASPATINVSAASQTINFQAVASDNLAVHAVTIAAHTSTGISGGYVDLGSSGVAHLNLTSGSKSNGTWTGSATVPKYFRPGTYYLSPTVEDATSTAVDAPARFGRDFGFFNPFAQALPGGATASFTVVNTGPVDLMPPQWLSTDYEPSTVDVRAGAQLVKVRVRLRDSLSGVAQAYGQLSLNNGLDFISFFSLLSAFNPSQAPPLSGDIHDGVWETSFVVPSVSPSGVAEFSASMRDTIGNFGDLNDGGPGPVGPNHEQLTIVSGGPSNPAESAWSFQNIPGFPYSATAALNADYDNDGLPNAVEFHLGTDPTDASNTTNETAAPLKSVVSNKLRLEFGQSQSNQALGNGAATKIVGQFSTDLIHWTQITPVALGGGMYAVEATPVSGKVYLRLAVVPAT